MSRSDKYAFTAIDQGLFHKVPQVDRESGQVRTNPKTHESYTEWVKCSGRACQGCQTALEHRYGYLQPWIMAKTHFNALNAMAPAIGTCCATCSGRSTIQPVSWHCGNPECATMIFDMRTSTATDEQIAQVVNAPYACRACQQTYYPSEQIVCANCTPNGWQPVRATIFDVDMHVQTPRTGENNSTVLQVVGMSDPKPLDQQFQDLLQYKPNLSQRFTADSLETQRQLWHISSNLQQGNQPQQGGYSQQPAPGPATYAQPYNNMPVQQPMPVQSAAPLMPAPQAPQPHQQPMPVPPQVPQQAAPQPMPLAQPPIAPQGGYMPPHGGRQ
jgi:hypothetical protein